jgi:hypothetical protein
MLDPYMSRGKASRPHNTRLQNTLILLLVAFAVGRYYLWGVRAAGNQFLWRYDLGGYYDYLGRAFAHGKLHVPIEPSPKLLAQPNPWDPAVDDSLKMQDMALFNGRYYLYHGAGPAVILFAPWRLLTGHDLPESFALFLLCFGGFLFSCGALLRLLAVAKAEPGPLLLGVMLLALGICQSVPYLLNRVWVYEIAIGGGYLCLSGALFFLAMSVESRRSAYWLAASGLMFGMAIACRPHLGAAGAIALAALAISRRGSVAAFLFAFALAGSAVAAYNYLRFGDPFEFGIRYLLAGANQNRINLSTRYVAPGFYFLLFCAPDFSPVFPWIRHMFRYPFNSPQYAFPAGYFIEPIVGALYVTPFIAGAWLAARVRQAGVRLVLWTALASSAAILLFLAATGFTTQRYEVDFLPLAVLAALTGFAAHIKQSAGLKRAALTAALIVSVAFSAVANLALGIAGPYDEMMKNRPASYVRIARWFSPVEQYRPLLNPRVAVSFVAEFTSQADAFREPLLTIGDRASRHFIYAEHLAGKLRIVSQSDSSTVAHEIARPERPVDIAVRYFPESGKLATTLDGQQVLAHDVATLVTAPAQVTVGQNRIDFNVTAPRFTGRLGVVRKETVGGARRR